MGWGRKVKGFWTYQSVFWDAFCLWLSNLPNPLRRHHKPDSNPRKMSFDSFAHEQSFLLTFIKNIYNETNSNPLYKKYEGGLLPTADLSLVQEKYQKWRPRQKSKNSVDKSPI